MNLELIIAENERMRQMLAELVENRSLRAAILDAGLPPPVAPRRQMMDLAILVAHQHECTVDDIRGPRRIPAVVAARHHFMWLARQPRERDQPRWTTGQIGLFLGRRPTTVTAGERAHLARLSVVSA